MYLYAYNTKYILPQMCLAQFCFDKFLQSHGVMAAHWTYDPKTSGSNPGGTILEIQICEEEHSHIRWMYF